MIKDQTLDEALLEIMRTKKALEALRKARKARTKRCWNSFCGLYFLDQSAELQKCAKCGEEAYEHGHEGTQHAAAKRASLDLTRKLADLRAGR